MSTRNALIFVAGAFGLAATSLSAEHYQLGSAVTDEEIRAWDIDVRADGRGLPPGRGSVMQGERVYQEKCAACHGDRGQGAPADRLAGGERSLDTAAPVRTVGSFWPYATTLFDYVRRAMPFNSPQSLNNDEVFAVTAYLLHLNEIIQAGATLDASSLPQIRMPNRDGFSGDPRPDVTNHPCQSNCR